MCEPPGPRARCDLLDHDQLGNVGFNRFDHQPRAEVPAAPPAAPGPGRWRDGDVPVPAISLPGVNYHDPTLQSSANTRAISRTRRGFCPTPAAQATAATGRNRAGHGHRPVPTARPTRQVSQPPRPRGLARWRDRCKGALDSGPVSPPMDLSRLNHRGQVGAARSADPPS